jgi:hypothetical protein
MATKEDILEQIVEEYLLHRGYFVRHNIKFKPNQNHPDFVRNLDSNHSDIDVLGYHPKLTGAEKVIAVSCKSWQGGFNPGAWIRAINENKKVSGRIAWQKFRELCRPKWSEAFVNAIKEATGSDRFTHVVAVAHVKGEKREWESHQPFRDAIGNNSMRILTFQDMITYIYPELNTTLAATEVGRMLQMFRAAGYRFDDSQWGDPLPIPEDSNAAENEENG